MRICLVVGARPNFMKVAPIVKALRRRGGVEWFLVHTGQHYDDSLSKVFFEELRLPEPDVWLGAGSGSHAEQTARVMTGFEPVCINRRPDLVVVVGDVNSSLAATIVAAKLCIPVAHVEAGLRSGDRTMPEEINRIVTDVLSEWLFTSCQDANENLAREGVPPEKVHFVGNVMIDSLLEHLPAALTRDTLARLGLAAGESGPEPYAVVTLHRPSNVDVDDTFNRLIRGLEHVASRVPVLFLVHPRTADRIRGRRVSGNGNLRLMEPLGYLDFVALMSQSALVLTDSGGVQEETTVLGVPCLTLRENTERPITISEGTNTLVGTSTERIIEEADRVLDGRARASAVPRLWDGRTAERIVDLLVRN